MTEHFFVVTPCRNAAQWIGRCIASVRMQTHPEWEMVVIDDASDDDTFRVAQEAAAGDERIRIVRNNVRRYALANAVSAINRYARHDAIIAMLDGDDRLSDSAALAAVTDAYRRDTRLDALWTAHAHDDGARAPLCRAIPPGVSPLDSDWRSSHLKTFRKRLLWGVDRRIWRDAKGEWPRSAYDVALYLPVLCLPGNSASSTASAMSTIVRPAAITSTPSRPRTRTRYGTGCAKPRRAARGRTSSSL